MPLSNHVPSLELCKKLKAAGYPQDTEFSWYETIDRDDSPRLNWTDEKRILPPCLPWEEKIAAPLVSEMGEWLLDSVNGECLKLWREKPDSWDVAYNTNAGNLKPMLWKQAETEADARAKMLIHLLEQKLLTPEELK
jgi:hypothetical protein